MKTINLKGKDYAPVSARVEQLHTDYKEASIETTYDFREGFVIFSATVKNGRGEFTGHAFGKIGQEKSFEKTETTAVGRALAFAGYLAGGEIASYDEVQAFIESETPQKPEMTTTEACAKLAESTSVDQLETVFRAFTPELKKDNEVIAKGTEVKAKLIK